MSLKLKFQLIGVGSQVFNQISVWKKKVFLGKQKKKKKKKKKNMDKGVCFSASDFFV